MRWSTYFGAQLGRRRREAAVWFARCERLGGGPRFFKAILDLFLRTDVRAVLESIQAPTLILHPRGDRHVAGGHAQYLAERIPEARLVELDGDDHLFIAGDTDRVLEADRIVPHRRTRRRAH